MLSVVFSTCSSVIGLYASYYLSISSGGAIVLACTTLFGIVFVFKVRDNSRSGFSH